MPKLTHFIKTEILSHRRLVWGGVGSGVLAAGLVAVVLVTATPAYACDAGGGGGWDWSWNWSGGSH
ncbi:MAG: hypothetical protein WA138_13650 [Parvibaculum sp.]